MLMLRLGLLLESNRSLNKVFLALSHLQPQKLNTPGLLLPNFLLLLQVMLENSLTNSVDAKLVIILKLNFISPLLLTK